MYMYGFVEFVIKVRWRSAWHGYQWCVRNLMVFAHVVYCIVELKYEIKGKETKFFFAVLCNNLQQTKVHR